MRFANQEWLWLLALLPVLWAALRWGDARARGRLARLLGPRAGDHVEDAAVAARSWRRTLLLLGAAALITALARPQWGANEVEVVQRGTDVVIALDVSNSMLAEDVAPSRLVRARAELDSFLEDYDRGQVGLVLFAGQAFVQCPLTLDLGAVSLFLGMAAPDMISTQGTALGSALDTSLDLLGEDEGGHGARRAVLLVTDGENLSGSWEDALARCRELGVAVIPVGVGLEAGGLVPLTASEGDEGGYLKDEQGNVVVSRLDLAALERLAGEGGGRLFRIGPGGLDRDALHERLKALGERDLSSRHVSAYAERFAWPLGAALLALAARFVVRPRRRRGTALLAASLLCAASPAAALDLLDERSAAVSEGVDHYMAGDYEQALALFENARAARPNDPRLALAVGEALARLERWPEAGREFARALELGEGPEIRADALYNAGTVALHEGDAAAAVAALREAYELAPERGDVLHNLEYAARLLDRSREQSDGDGGQQGDDRQQGQDQPQSGDSSGDSDGDRSSEPQQSGQEPQGHDGPQEHPQDSGEDPQRQQESRSDRPEESEPRDASADSLQASPETGEQAPDAEAMSRQRALAILKALDRDEEELRRAVQQRLQGETPRGGKRW